MKTILMTAYAVNPYKGSEDGMGWNMIIEVAKYNKVIAITRENNAVHIERYLKEHSVPQAKNIDFQYFDLPYYLRFWKKGERGALLYFYMWQYGIVSFVRKNKLIFDIAHNLNFHNDWTPSFLWRLKKPFVWGPIGHHPRIPKEYLSFYGNKALRKDQLTWFAKQLFWTIDPFLKQTKNKADKILAMNSSVKKALQVSDEKLVLLPSVGSETIDREHPIPSNGFTIISVGRFVALKGFDITIRSFAHFYHQLSDVQKNETKLILVGKGKSQKALENLIVENKVQDAVQIIEWIDRAELLKLYQQAHLFFFPSHEGAGMVVSEALSLSIPVLCFDNYGPGEFVDETCGIKIPYSTPKESIHAFAQELQKLYADRTTLNELSKAAKLRHQNLFRWAIKGELMTQVYEELMNEKNKSIKQELLEATT